jgi:hypothetical protein
MPPTDFEQGLDTVARLVKQFNRNAATYRNPDYNETRARIEFINPLFEALGWDVTNREGNAPQYQEVIHEFSEEIEGVRKAPDYAFRTGSREPKFFVEAKKPGVNVKTDARAAYQLRRYAWSARLPLSILTDFDEFAVYDCRARPSDADKASAGRINLYTCESYPDRFREIWDVFSRSAVRSGSFDRFTSSERGKRGTSLIDVEFLQEIEGWRDELARNLALRNAWLSSDELNDAVQRTIDRIIFLRMAEDRGIEEYGRLQKLADSPTLVKGTGEGSIYADLIGLCRKADGKYNSGLFDLQADPLTPRLSVDDKALKSILSDLYFPHSPYEFSVLPPEILGNVYEQFLGKVIRLTAGHQAKVEEKPEVKKAGGVYYTPAYIVEYIVKNTVGKLVEGKSPKQLESFRCLDPACGSGSFLLGAYQHLLDYYLQWYTEEEASGKKQAGKVYQLPSPQYGAQAGGGGWRLTTAEKKRILTTHIFGVDIDRQAVEVTKLSLLLKVLEGESDETLGQQLTLLQERALPNLDNNIKCGNSLIGPDYFAGRLPLDKDEQKRVNPFDWQKEFPDAMKAGGPSASSGQGFDCVIGNPPYVRIQTMKEWAPLEVEIYKEQYAAARSGNYDIYVVFVEKVLSLLNKRGRLGFILPHKFFNAQYGEPLRSLLAKGKYLSHVVHFGDQQVFVGATTYTCLMFLDKAGGDECQFVKVDDLAAWRTAQTSEVSQDLGGLKAAFTEGTIPAANITATEWNFAVGKGAALFERLSKMPVKLGDMAHLFVGLQTDADDVFILEEVRKDKKRVLCQSKFTGREHWFEDTHLKPFLKGSLNIRRYCLTDVTKRLIFPYETKEGKSVLIEAKDYKRRYPLTWTYLEENRERLVARNKGQMGQEWYAYVYKKNHTQFGNPKLLVPSIATGSCFAADLDGTFYFVGSGGGGGGGYGITLLAQTVLSYLYLLGLLNSSLLSTYLKTISTPFRGGYIALNRQYIEQLPIRPINFSDPADVGRHDRMVTLVEQMLELHKHLHAATSASDRELYQRQIDATDREIDKLVYELYGLTEAEIKIVEAKS